MSRLCRLWRGEGTTKITSRLPCRSNIVLKNKPNVSDERSAIEYNEFMHNYTDDLRILQKALRRLIK